MLLKLVCTEENGIITHTHTYILGGVFLRIYDLFCSKKFLMQEAVARLEEIKKSIEAKMALRQSNLNPERPG